MRIAQLAPLQEKLPPSGYGGSELVAHLLTEELVRRGHDVTLFASGDSETAGRLVPCAESALRPTRKTPQTRWAAFEMSAALRVVSMASEFDIVHNHLGWVALPILHQLKIPVVTTNHNLILDHVRDIYLAYRSMPYVAISNAYRRLNYPEQMRYVGTVYNGIDLSQHTFAPSGKRAGLLFLGRVGPEKGTLEAIEIAHRLGLPLTIAGKVDARDTEYFESMIRPHLGRDGIDFVGEVSFDEKIGLYSRAVATLCPIKFEEPFGLVMAESLAAGTPVMAFDRGAVSEVVTDGETGIIGQSVDDLVRRFSTIESISNVECRRRAESHFSKEKMTDGYESVYAGIRCEGVVSM